MANTPTLAELQRQAREIVDAVADDPEGRLELRKRWYEDNCSGTDIALGRSEIDFTQWEIDRGVLAPVDQGGSPWWREVNSTLSYNAELAALINNEAPEIQSASGPVRLWQAFLAKPSGKSWYCGHNSSIIQGYLDHTDLAFKEDEYEQIFMNMVLYRVLYAQGLVEGLELGRIGALLSNPMLPSVKLLIGVEAFYPSNYPLSEQDIKYLLHESGTLEGEAEKDFDDALIIPELGELYRHATGWNQQPGLELMLQSGIPSYPSGGASPHGDQGEHPVVKSDSEAPERKKIVILGGGPAALGAAFELTDYEGWQDRYDVTLYQLGWRLGGKTASGFGGPTDRIEERGIHIFQGWYNNAFRIVQTAYAYIEEHGLAPGSPLVKWSDAFVPDNATLLTEYDETTKEWTNWPLLIPANSKIPGQGGPPPVQEIVHEGIGLFIELILGSPYGQDTKKGCVPDLARRWLMETFFTPDYLEAQPEWWKQADSDAHADHKHESDRVEVRWLLKAKGLAAKMSSEPTVKLGLWEVSALRVVTELFGACVGFLRQLGPDDLAADDKMAHIIVLAEFGLANMRGMVDDVYDEKTHTFNFRAINADDYREWLLANGLPKELDNCAPLRFIYGGCFHNQYFGKPGRLAADLGLRSLLASITYRGSLVWKLIAGTGGTLIAPIYKILKHRGVKFEFFHDVKKIHYAEGKKIEKITIARQVDLRPDLDEYDPLMNVKRVDNWPTLPLYEQLDPDQAAKLEEGNVDLESPWAKWEPVDTKTLELGADFDDIILGIPIKATAIICADIVAKKEAWQNMVRYVRATPTFGTQLWMRPSLEELGMKMSKFGMEPGDEPNSVCYADLMYSWTDMTGVLPFEGWSSSDQPGQLSYYCGTWPADPLPPFSDHDYPDRELERLKQYASGWLSEEMGWFWPKSIKDGQFDGTLLVDPSDPENVKDISGAERLANQWYCVNVSPSDQYTLAWPDSDQYRLAADESGYDNFYLCGDWTDFGLNIGHMEGAVTSGLEAAQAILIRDGQTEVNEIYPAVGMPGKS